MNHGKRDSINDIKFKNSMRTLSFCNYSDAHIHVKETITIPNTAAVVKPQIMLIKKYHNINVVMPMYNLIEYSDTCSKTSGSL